MKLQLRGTASDKDNHFLFKKTLSKKEISKEGPAALVFQNQSDSLLPLF